MKLTGAADIIDEQYDKSLRDLRYTETLFAKKRAVFAALSRFAGDITQPIGYMIILYQMMVQLSGSLAGLAIVFAAYSTITYGIEVYYQAFQA